MNNLKEATSPTAISLTPDETPIDLEGIETWAIEAPDGASVLFKQDVESRLSGVSSIGLTLSGSGKLTLRAPEPIELPPNCGLVYLWIYLETPFDPENIPEIALEFEGDRRCILGRLDFVGWHCLYGAVDQLGSGHLHGLSFDKLLLPAASPILLNGPLCRPSLAPTEPAPPADFGAKAQTSCLPVNSEEVENSIRKDGISFILESRSLSAVVRYIYTPIEGNLADFEVEINNSDVINPADTGGITIEMGGKEWDAESEEIERHFVSCEQVGDRVEARWQWKYGDELADFLYRFSLEGKSLVVEMDGGNGKATGVDLGRVSGAVHPHTIRIPYYNWGSGEPAILCTSGTFITSQLDTSLSHASSLYAFPFEVGVAQSKINGGCRYRPLADGKRPPLKERWILTVSRHFAEVLPSLPAAETVSSEELAQLAWLPLGHLKPVEEAYVEVYEQLRQLKMLGMDHLMVHHSPSTWHDSTGPWGLPIEGAARKGGDDALIEYLEAVQELGYVYSLAANFSAMSPQHPAWDPAMAAQLPDGTPIPSYPGHYLLSPIYTGSMVAQELSALEKRYNKPLISVGSLTATPPWERLDEAPAFDGAGARFLNILGAEQDLLTQLSQARLLIGEGGSHWLYRGLLAACFAHQAGKDPSQSPLFIDFALRHQPRVQIDIGLGSIDTFFGNGIPQEERHSRSSYLDRYLATTLAFGQAACLPPIASWGLASAIKTYYLVRQLQTNYLGVEVESIQYHHDGNFLDTDEALISKAYENSQVSIRYANGLQLYVNGAFEDNWSIDYLDRPFLLPPGSFLAHKGDSLFAYSADSGQGRMDFLQCPNYLYFDTRGQRSDMGPAIADGAMIIANKNWEIDLYPLECSDSIEIFPAYFWSERRLPRLRVLAFKWDESKPELLKSDMVNNRIVINQVEDAYKYRITLPEWMVEPGE